MVTTTSNELLTLFVSNSTSRRAALSNSTSSLLAAECGDNSTLLDAHLSHQVATRHLILYGAPLVVLFGTICNLLLFLVMLRPRIRRSLTSHYLRVLAVADTCVLWIGYPRHWVWAVWGVDFRASSNVSCKLHKFLLYWSCYFSAWVLVCVTLERLHSVFCPLRARATSATPRRATSFVFLSLGVIMALLCGHIFWSIWLASGSSSCTVVPSWGNFERNIWPWLDLLVYCLLPFTVITVANILIITRTRRLSAKRSVHTHSLVLVSTVYLLTTSPYELLSVLDHQGLLHLHCYTKDLVYAVGTFLYFVNNAVNFLIYCLCSRRFRGEFVGMVVCRRTEEQLGRRGESYDCVENTPTGEQSQHLTKTPACQPL